MPATMAGNTRVAPPLTPGLRVAVAAPARRWREAQTARAELATQTPVIGGVGHGLVLPRVPRTGEAPAQAARATVPPPSAAASA